MLEREVKQPPPAGVKWVPVVPEGQCTANLTWKRWLFLQMHAGFLGAHRNADKTYGLLIRQCWWRTPRTDVDTWIKNCSTCERFRKIPQKQVAQAAIPIDAECWEEVMFDFEGPSQPCDKEGNRYGSSYVCCLCHGVLCERSTVLNGREARRMFASSVFRSGRIPTLLRTDGGPELKNVLMQEYCALVGIGRRF